MVSGAHACLCTSAFLFSWRYTNPDKEQVQEHDEIVRLLEHGCMMGKIR